MTLVLDFNVIVVTHQRTGGQAASATQRRELFQLGSVDTRFFYAEGV